MQSQQFEQRRGICMSLRPSGDVYEIVFEDVRLLDGTGNDAAWQRRKALQFAVMTPAEIEGRISRERCAEFGMSILDLLSYLARHEPAA